MSRSAYHAKPGGRRRLATAVVSAAILTATAGSAAAAGPWRGQVFDADTGAPLSDVVVLAVWTRRSPGFVHDAWAFHDVDEVVTDDAGRFEIPRRLRLTWRPFTRVVGPDIRIMKVGYDLWKFRLPPVLDVDDSFVRARLVEEAWKQFEGAGAIFELIPARTPQQRRHANVTHEVFAEVPRCRVPRWLAAYNAERRELGFEPMPACP